MNKIQVFYTLALLVITISSCNAASWSTCPGYSDAKLKITNVSFNPKVIAWNIRNIVTMDGTALQSDTQKNVEIQIKREGLDIENFSAGEPYSIDPKTSYKYTFDFTLVTDYPPGMYEVLFLIKSAKDTITCFQSSFSV